MSRLLAALAAATLLAACSLPGTLQARAFTTGFKAGETIRYRVHTVVSGSLSLNSQQLPLSSDQTVTEQLTVKSVDRSGTASVELGVVDLIQQATGAAGSAAPQPAVLQIGSDGRIRAGAAVQLGGPIPSIPGSDQLTPLLPGRPVAPGDSWTQKYSRPNPYGSGGFQFSGHSRYLRDEAVSGAQTAAIETTLAGPIDFTIDYSKLPQPPAPSSPPSSLPAGPIHYTGTVTSTTTYWIDLDSRQVVKSTGSGSYVLDYGTALASGVSGPQQVTFNGTIKTEVAKF
ncbi:MAG TPA: hypothetical protein VNG93_06615 [Candidatus Dormibacteraeota bacterium]|nr:hypothetical protein [Candidatus Dormibacteraeota bacterium]